MGKIVNGCADLRRTVAGFMRQRSLVVAGGAFGSVIARGAAGAVDGWRQAGVRWDMPELWPNWQ